MELAVKYDESNIVEAYWEKLRLLSSKSKLKLVTLLTTAVLEEEDKKEETKPTRRVAKIVHKSANSPSDAELQARFAGMETPELPEDPEWKQVINANTGKTIKPIEKWL